MKTIISATTITLLLMSKSFGDYAVHRAFISLPITSVKGPSFANRYETVYLEVSFSAIEGRVEFNESITKNTRTIELRLEHRVVAYKSRIGTAPGIRFPELGNYRKCPPPNYAHTDQYHVRNAIQYRFSTSSAGTYYFKFKSYNGRYVTHVLTIR